MAEALPRLATVCKLPDQVAAAREMARLMGDALREALSTRSGRVGVMVSGGRTPSAVLPPVLARDDIDWDRVDVVASDERLVAVDDPASTERLIRGIFKAANQPCHYIGFGADTDPDTALDHWRKAIDAMAWPPVVAFLGVGDDGHTASLFPNRVESADMALGTAAVPETAPHIAPRLTFGFGALRECETILVVVNSAKKSDQLHRARKTSVLPGEVPVAGLWALPQTVFLETAT